MSIMNRRNAVVGWATWSIFKQVLKRNAKAEAAAAEEETKRSRRFRRKEEVVEVEEKPRRKRGKRRLVGAVVATGIGVGAWLGTRRKPKGEQIEPKGEELE
jgi:hypothetical protein